MARDDEVDENTSFDPTFATAGPRRSTFTPPPGSPAYPSPTGAGDGSDAGETEQHDDDELAQALAADLGRIASGAITVPTVGATPEPVVSEPASPPGSPEPTAGEEGAPPASDPDPALAPPSVPASWVQAVLPDAPRPGDNADTAPVPSLRAEGSPAPAVPPISEPVMAPSATDLTDAPPPQPGAVAAGDVPPPAAPWSSLPAPDPADAVDIPGAPPRAPQRRSLTDAELLALADGGDAGRGIEQLEEQLRLREAEAREFSTWEARMLALGTPDAFAAVRDARSQFSDVIGVPTTPGTGAIPVPDSEVSAPAEAATVVAPDAPDSTVGAPEPVESVMPGMSVDGVAPAAPVDEIERPLPAWDVPPPSATWSPGPDPDDDVVPPAAAALAGGASSVLSDEIADAIGESASSEAPQHVWSLSLDEDSVPPAAADAGSESAGEAQGAWPHDGPDGTGELGAEIESGVEVESSTEVESDAEVESVSSFAPPALVEPPPFGGPALLPSEAASVPPPLIDSIPVFAAAAAVEGDAVAEGDPGASPMDDLVDPEEPETDVPSPQADGELPYPTMTASPEPSEPDDAIDDVVEAVIVGDESGEVHDAGPTTGPVSSWGRAFSFDDLIAGPAEDDSEEPARAEPESAAAGVFGAAESLFIEPLPVAAGEAVPTETGSVAIIDPAYEEETDDVVAETDRVAYVGGEPTGPVVLPPSGPISTTRVADDEDVLHDAVPVAPRAFAVETVGPEPTPLDRRVGTAARLFWLWFAANASVISLGLGATVFAIGMSLRQSIVAILVGVALSFIPLGLTTLAGKRSGQPTMIVSRASFGHRGNVLPAVLAVVTRVFWGAVMLWLAASAVAIVLVGAGLDGGLPESMILILSLAVLFGLAFVVAIFGYGLFARIQLVLSMLSAVLVMGFIVLTAGYIDVATALTIPDASWLRVIGGAVLVFSVVGLVWAHSGSDLARYQRPDSSGAGSMLWATFGAALPAFILVAYGALLAASNERIAEGFVTSPLDTLALMLPSWYPVPLIAATVLSLLSGVVITIYSGGFAVQAVGVRVARSWGVLIVAILLGGATLAVGFALPGGFSSILRDAATTLAVPTAAWAGIITAETMIRNRRFESGSLVSRGGVYGDWRWANLIGFVLISALGYGATTAQVAWLSWQGYVLDFFGVPRDSDLAATDLGVLLALALGLLLPIIVGIPAIRRQEETRV